jgi:hypothetical protein
MAPSSGPPSAPLPMNTSRYKPITRPRSASAAVSCTVELAAVRNSSVLAPTAISRSRQAHSAALAAASVRIAQATMPVPVSVRSRVPPRRAEASAPSTEPSATAEVSKPYPLGPEWNSLLA